MRPRHTLIVQKRKPAPTAGSVGQAVYVADGTPVPVRGNVHPLTTEEIRNYGDQAKDLRKFFCRAWPGDMFSEITFEGDKYDQVEPVKKHDLGHLTKHAEVILRRRSIRG